MTGQQIERYLAGHLDAASRRAVEAELAADAGLRARVEQRRQDKAAFLVDPRRRRFADLVDEAHAGRATGRSGWPKTLAWVGLLGAAAAVGLMLIWPSAPHQTRPKYAVKGGVSVQLAVQRAGQVRPYAAGAALHAGDRVRISIDDPHGGYVTVLVEDERAVSVLYGPDETGRLSPGRHTLPGSLELDQVAGRERIWVLVSQQAQSTEDWRAQIESARHGAGFDHGWLPRAPTRLTTIEYRKAPQ